MGPFIQKVAVAEAAGCRSGSCISPRALMFCGEPLVASDSYMHWVVLDRLFIAAARHRSRIAANSTHLNVKDPWSCAFKQNGWAALTPSTQQPARGSGSPRENLVQRSAAAAARPGHFNEIGLGILC
jgi:hypothetical protein